MIKTLMENNSSSSSSSSSLPPLYLIENGVDNTEVTGGWTGSTNYATFNYNNTGYLKFACYDDDSWTSIITTNVIDASKYNNAYVSYYTINDNLEDLYFSSSYNTHMPYYGGGVFSNTVISSIRDLSDYPQNERNEKFNQEASIRLDYGSGEVYVKDFLFYNDDKFFKIRSDDGTTGLRYIYDGTTMYQNLYQLDSYSLTDTYEMQINNNNQGTIISAIGRLPNININSYMYLFGCNNITSLPPKFIRNISNGYVFGDGAVLTTLPTQLFSGNVSECTIFYNNQVTNQLPTQFFIGSLTNTIIADNTYFYNGISDIFNGCTGLNGTTYFSESTLLGFSSCFPNNLFHGLSGSYSNFEYAFVTGYVFDNCYIQTYPSNTTPATMFPSGWTEAQRVSAFNAAFGNLITNTISSDSDVAVWDG